MRVRSLGSIARQIIVHEQEARLLGVTSQGIFVCTPSNWVMFLTGGVSHGPLTLNLDGLPDTLLEDPGDPVSIRPGGFWFPKSDVWVPVDGAEQWSPPPCKAETLSPAEIRFRLEEVSQEIRACEDLATGATLSDLPRTLQNGHAEQAAGQVSGILGRGTGLTPAGDDLALGLLLALNRWGRILFKDFPPEPFNSLLVQDARRKTTTLSANLIECAAQGQADERLVTGLDGLVTGIPGAATCAACFNQWGNSSGGNAFLGMRLALTCLAR